MIRLLRVFCVLSASASVAVCAETPQPPDAVTEMTPERLGELIMAVDPQATVGPNNWQFAIEGHTATVVYDAAADRMRIVIPIKPAEQLGDEELQRLMQANFDSALDARYALAQSVLWATYIHPLSSLQDEQFLGAIGQTVNIVLTYGSTYSSGELIFGGGDSGELQRRELIERLKDLGTTT